MKFTITTDEYDERPLTSFDMFILDQAVGRLAAEDGAFVVVTPESPVQGITYMQAMFVRETKGVFKKKVVRACHQVEAQMAKPNGDLVQYTLELYSGKQVWEILRDFFESLTIPDLSSWRSELFYNSDA